MTGRKPFSCHFMHDITHSNENMVICTELCSTVPYTPYLINWLCTELCSTVPYTPYLINWLCTELCSTVPYTPYLINWLCTEQLLLFWANVISSTVHKLIMYGRVPCVCTAGLVWTEWKMAINLGAKFLFVSDLLLSVIKFSYQNLKGVKISIWSISVEWVVLKLSLHVLKCPAGILTCYRPRRRGDNTFGSICPLGFVRPTLCTT